MGSGSILNWISSQADILNNIANNLGPVQKLITGAAYIMGIMFAFKAMYSLKSFGEMKTSGSPQSNLKEPVVYLLIASVLIYFPSTLQVMLMTTFGSSSILQYGPINTNSSTLNVLFGSSAIGLPLTIIIQTVGLWAFVKGWIMIAKSASGGQQPGGTGKGLVHVFGGIFAINIVQTINIINNTLYGT